VIHNGFKSARPLARLKAGRNDWYRIENKADGPVEVYIYDEIGYFGITAADFARDFKQITAPEITLHLDTPGGDVFDAVNIYNAVADHPAQVTAIVDGLAASAGSFILQAGDKRVMNRYSTLMVHNGHSMTAGDASAMRKQADLLDKITGTIAQVYTDKAGQTPEHWREVMQVETWFTAEEAMDAGLADEVIMSTDKLARNDFDLTIFSYAGRDHAPAPVLAKQETPEEVPDAGIDWTHLADALKGAFA
jgi:ATP-dependent Clp endopeptidase proteolytic subunit ClpP